MPTHELCTMEEFDEAVRSRKYIVVTDSAGPPKAHVASCTYLRAANFETKVIVGRCRNGRYYACDTAEEALALARGRGCGSCFR